MGAFSVKRVLLYELILSIDLMHWSTQAPNYLKLRADHCSISPMHLSIPWRNWILTHEAVLYNIGPDQTPHFTWAESNANEKNPLLFLISIRFSSCEVRRLIRALCSDDTTLEKFEHAAPRHENEIWKTPAFRFSCGRLTFWKRSFRWPCLPQTQLLLPMTTLLS